LENVMADVVELIKAQHRRIDELLAQAEQAEPDQLAALLRQVADLLLPHSEAEESFVYPAIKDYDTSEADEVKDGVAEHHHMEGLLQELLTEDPSGPGYDGKLAAMIGELRHHVEEEEQDLLPVLTEQASDEEREELGARFAEVTGHQLEDEAARAEPSPAKGSDGDGVTREELYEQAKKNDVPGRSTMSKDELARALEQG
jgi:hemerythrin superfamily protein